MLAYSAYWAFPIILNFIHRFAVFCCVSLTLTRSLSRSHLSFSLSHTYSLSGLRCHDWHSQEKKQRKGHVTHAHTLTHALTHSLTHSHTLSHTHTHTHSHTHTLTLTHTDIHTLTRSHTLTHTLTHTFTGVVGTLDPLNGLMLLAQVYPHWHVLACELPWTPPHPPPHSRKKVF